MQWEGSNTGPGWQDVCDMLTALDSLHGCETSVLLRREGEDGVSRLSITVYSVLMTPKAADWQLDAAVTGHYPCNGHRTLAGLIFGMLHRQDRQINSQWYEQRQLPL